MAKIEWAAKEESPPITCPSANLSWAGSLAGTAMDDGVLAGVCESLGGRELPGSDGPFVWSFSNSFMALSSLLSMRSIFLSYCGVRRMRVRFLAGLTGV